ncbi:hypothetical protein [Cellvibrio sp. PSBB023]|uniref:hypothetical protein n=1 Tax=Cellvibrio sp. PSBB023 TaxID=1945512 RepID=UPI0009901711|nr:hypothetical protein [Cellvibrio sp. PSBB023]AQT60421.1 hypothetical protein B0D95_10170 [Cellvibrio sp. PSBB023]
MDTQFAQRPEHNYRDGVISTQPENDSVVAWCAVFAGAVASAALSLILLLLGTGFGLTLVSPWSSEGISSTSFGVSSIVGITLISLVASAIGGYIAGRMRTRWINTPNDEVYFRDTAHGFLSWAVATLGTAALLTSVISGIMGSGIKTSGAIAGSAAGIAASGVSAALMTDKSDSNTTLTYILDDLLRKQPNAAATHSRQQPLAMENSVDGSLTSEPAPQTSNNMPAMHKDSPKAELMRIFVYAIATDSLPQQDVKYAGQLVAQETGIDQPTAEKHVTDNFTLLRQKLDEAETAALAAADKARELSAYASLWLFISLLSGAFIASLMAVYGGRQRDLN